MELKIISVIEEQIAVEFTGKINVLSTYNQQFLGQIIFKNGDILQVTFQVHKGLKAFYQLIIQEYSLQSFDYVVEPEVIDEKQRQIHYPYSIMKNKLSDVLKLYRESLKQKPPKNVKIIVNGEFMHQTSEVTPDEFEVLATLSEWNGVDDVYQHCPLLDHEITGALVSLRKKNALKILAPRSNG